MHLEKVHPLAEIVERHRAGEPVGVYCLCTVNPFVLETAMARLRNREKEILFIESTANQVNQTGGYSGMNPEEFVRLVLDCAERVGIEPNRIVIGGDHLGPLVWCKEASRVAMERACELIRQCVEAGYTKIHLDATAVCGDDPRDDQGSLPCELVAQRTAMLCAAAEDAADRIGVGVRPVYVIGSDVPSPGGVKHDVVEAPVSSVESVAEIVEATQVEFGKRGLEAAWERVMAVVARPGVEFGETTVVDYSSERTAALARYIESVERLVYEGHSTDYQTTESLRRMVEDHFAILKVGPWLTFAFREAILLLEAMEVEWLGQQQGIELSRVGATLENVMLENPVYWNEYHGGDENRKQFARRFAFSDRVRYYWSDPRVERAVSRLLANLELHPPPLPLLSFFMSEEYNLVRAGLIPNRPRALLRSRIAAVLAAYDYACGGTVGHTEEGRFEGNA